jgi:hypothetical protein
VLDVAVEVGIGIGKRPEGESMAVGVAFTLDEGDLTVAFVVSGRRSITLDVIAVGNFGEDRAS